MRVLICAYRDWAKEISHKISNNKNIIIVDNISDQKSLIKKLQNGLDVDLILFIGWSWIINDDITNQYLCIGIHPSDLPHYKGGSPIQNQIINGIIKSKVTLFTLSSKLDSGDIWYKEDVDFNGNNMNEIFKNIIDSSVTLLENFFKEYPNIEPITQKIGEGSYFKRRSPIQSKLVKQDLQNMNTLELYNFIRCLTTPYPNAYFEDNDGNSVFFEEVSFSKK